MGAGFAVWASVEGAQDTLLPAESREEIKQEGWGLPALLCGIFQMPRALGSSPGSVNTLGHSSCPHSWHCIKPQRFQEHRPHFREARDKVISPRTHKGGPLLSLPPGAQRHPCQNSRQKVTQQRRKRAGKASLWALSRSLDSQGSSLHVITGSRSSGAVALGSCMKPLGCSAGHR